MPQLSGFPRHLAVVGMVVALLALGGLVGWRLHGHHPAGGGDGATLVMARIDA